MSQKTTPIITEYFVTTHPKELNVTLDKYTFDGLTPNGAERTLLTIHYTNESGFQFKEAKALCTRLADKLNTYDFSKGKPVYYR